jgi:hypothetical protein
VAKALARAAAVAYALVSNILVDMKSSLPVSSIDFANVGCNETQNVLKESCYPISR